MSAAVVVDDDDDDPGRPEVVEEFEVVEVEVYEICSVCESGFIVPDWRKSWSTSVVFP